MTVSINFPSGLFASYPCVSGKFCCSWNIRTKGHSAVSRVILRSYFVHSNPYCTQICTLLCECTHPITHIHTCKSLTCTLSPSVAIMLASAAAIELRPTPELLLTPEPKPPDASKICAWGRVHPVLTVTRTNRSIYIARLCIFAKFCLFQLDSAYTKIPHLLPNCIRPCHFHVFNWMAFIRMRDAGV